MSRLCVPPSATGRATCCCDEWLHLGGGCGCAQDRCPAARRPLPGTPWRRAIRSHGSGTTAVANPGLGRRSSCMRACACPCTCVCVPVCMFMSVRLCLNMYDQISPFTLFLAPPLVLAARAITIGTAAAPPLAAGALEAVVPESPPDRRRLTLPLCVRRRFLRLRPASGAATHLPLPLRTLVPRRGDDPAKCPRTCPSI